MIISDAYKFIFVHIGRTAGTSVEDSLLKALGSEYPTQEKGERHELILKALYDGREAICPDLRNLAGRKHATLAELKEIAGSQKFRNYFKFATIRNPWDHELSIYTKGRAKAVGVKYSNSSFPRMDFDRHLAKRYLLRRKPRNTTFMDFFTVDGEVTLDAVIRFEKLDVDFQSVCSEIGLDAKLLNNGDASRVRASPSDSDHRAYYTPFGRSIVARARRKDAAWFEYTF